MISNSPMYPLMGGRKLMLDYENNGGNVAEVKAVILTTFKTTVSVWISASIIGRDLEVGSSQAHCLHNGARFPGYN